MCRMMHVQSLTLEDFFTEGEGVVLLRIFNSVVELFCGKTTSDTHYYSKQSVFIHPKNICLEGLFKLSQTNKHKVNMVPFRAPGGLGPQGRCLLF